MSQPEVTIIIPVYNRVAYLPELFDSLCAVDYAALHVLLVDNGSADNSLSLCQAFAAEHPRWVRVLQAERRGANVARNAGLAVCETEWVYFFDSDDTLSPHFLRRLTPLCEGQDIVVFPTNLRLDASVCKRDFIPSPSVEAQILSATLNTQGVLWRTDFLRGIGGWDERLQVWQDWELGVRALLRKPRMAWFQEEAFHLIGVRADGITRQTGWEERQQALQVAAAELSTPRQRRALYLRQQVWRGLFHRPASGDMALSPQGVCEAVLGRLLWCYVRLGGRGGWRLARLFVR